MRASMIGHGRKPKALPGGVSKKVRQRYLAEKGAFHSRQKQIHALNKQIAAMAQKVKKSEALIDSERKKFDRGEVTSGNVTTAVEVAVKHRGDLFMLREKLRALSKR